MQFHEFDRWNVSNVEGNFVKGLPPRHTWMRKRKGGNWKPRYRTNKFSTLLRSPIKFYELDHWNFSSAKEISRKSNLRFYSSLPRIFPSVEYEMKPRNVKPRNSRRFFTLSMQFRELERRKLSNSKEIPFLNLTKENNWKPRCKTNKFLRNVLFQSSLQFYQRLTSLSTDVLTSLNIGNYKN